MTNRLSHTGRLATVSMMLAICLLSPLGASGVLGQDQKTIVDVAALRASTPGPEADLVYLAGYFQPGDGGQGLLIRLPRNTAARDDGVCIFVTANGQSYYRESCERSVAPKQAGAYADRKLFTTDHITISHDGYLLTVAGAHFFKSDVDKEIILSPAANRAGSRARIRDVIDETGVRTTEPLTATPQYACHPQKCAVTYGRDDIAAFERLMAVADKRRSPVRLGSHEYLLSRGIAWNNTTTSVRGSGAVLDFSLMKGGAATTISVSGNDEPENEKIGRIISRPNGGYSIICNRHDGTAGASTGITFVGIDATGVPSVTISNVNVNDCRYGIELPGSDKLRGAGLTDVTFDRLRLQSNQYGIYAAPGEAVASEKIAILNSFIVNSRDAGIYLDNPSYDAQIANTSIDGGKTGIYTNGSQVEMSGGHMEAITGHYADVTGAGSTISMSNVSIAMSWTRSQALFHAGRTTSSINLDHDIIVRFAGTEFLGDTIADGAGRFIVHDPVVTIQGASEPLPLFSDKANAIANGAFTRENVAGWVHSKGTAATLDRETGHRQPGSLQFSGPASLHYAFACHPGAYAGVQGYFRADGLKETGGELRMALLWLDAAGQVIENATDPKASGDLASWTRFRLLGDVQTKSYAPPGTAFAAASVEITQARPGKLKAWADDINGFCY